jgi:8-oxo-dGTP diphosphatase
MAVGRFLCGVGALVWDPGSSRYLLLRRSGEKDFAPGRWECVTGRVDQGEGFEDAVRREVREETGIEVALDFIIGTTHFHRGAARAENELLGVVYHCSRLDGGAIAMSPEHDAMRWVTAPEALALLDGEVATEAWLRRVIARAEALRTLLPAALIEQNRERGFELG